MADVLTKKQRSFNMSQIKAKNTKPEIMLRKHLFSKGLRGYRIHSKIIGKPDIVFPKQKIAIFIDGCFWHKCPRCFKKPKTNNKFWKDKINSNVKRDKKINNILKKEGWKILRLWEHEIRKDIIKCINKVNRELNKRSIKVIDLFCGAGGLSYGFKKAGFNILLGIDSDKSALTTFKQNHKSSKILCGNIKNFSISKIKKSINNLKADIVVGGPPCQGFSMAGKRKQDDPRNTLFKQYLRIVKGLRPKIFVMENVKGLLSMKDSEGKKIIDIILDKFQKADYNVKLYSINTADYGVPQKRKRIFIIGTKGKYNFNFPNKTHSESGKELLKWSGIKNIILDKRKVDKKYFYSEKLIRGFKRREKINRKKKRGFGWQFLDPDNPSYTISARYWKDGAEALIKYNSNTIRMLTPEECARIQSFTKSFKFCGNKREIYGQIGNAVPPLVSYNIAKAIIKII